MSKIRMAVLLSGSGRTLENFCASMTEGKLDVEIVVVGASRADAYGLVRAQNHGIESFCVPSKLADENPRAFFLPCRRLRCVARRRVAGPTPVM